MSYYNLYPYNYGNNLPTIPNQLPSYQPPAMNNSIIWVQGESGAKAYPVAAGSTVLLMDSESEAFYIKTTDTNGMPKPLKKYTYSEVVESTVEEPTKTVEKPRYITHDEFERLLDKALDDRLGNK